MNDFYNTDVVMECAVGSGYKYPIGISPMLSGSLDLLPEPYCIRAPDSPFIYANPSLAKFIGLRSVYDVIDKLDYEIASRYVENADTLAEWNQQDRSIVISRKFQTMLELHPHAVDNPYICRKVPFYNNEHQCVGVFISFKLIEVFTPNDFVKGKLPGSLLLNKPDNMFTEPECEILFFWLQGINSKTIAEILGVAKRTVERRLAAIYFKADIDHHDDLVAVCQRLNLHRYLPKRIMTYKRYAADWR